MVKKDKLFDFCIRVLLKLGMEEEKAIKTSEILIEGDMMGHSTHGTRLLPMYIADIEKGLIDKENNPLKNAPHTVEDLVEEWNRPYSREQGCFPVGAFRVDKYWPPVNRVDNVYGDRNLICTCPPMSEYSEAAE